MFSVLYKEHINLDVKMAILCPLMSPLSASSIVWWVLEYVVRVLPCQSALVKGDQCEGYS